MKPKSQFSLTRAALSARDAQVQILIKGTRETAIKILKEQDKWIGQKVTMTYNGWTGKGTPNFGQIDPNNCAVGDR